MTFTTLRPCPSGTARCTISPETEAGNETELAAIAKKNTIAPTRPAIARDDATTGRRLPLESLGEAAQDEDEHDGRQGLHRYLREGEVGRAVRDEQRGHCIAGRAEEDGGREPPANRRGAERGDDEETDDREVGDAAGRVGPSRPAPFRREDPCR